MPDARTSTDARPPTATVCTCGYDLTGLPADAAAKCPECGVVIAELPPPAPPLRVRMLPVVGWLSPGLLLALAETLDRLGPGMSILDVIVGVLEVVAVVGIAALSIPISVFAAARWTRRAPPSVYVVAAFVAIVASVFGNPLVGWAISAVLVAIGRVFGL